LAVGQAVGQVVEHVVGMAEELVVREIVVAQSKIESMEAAQTVEGLTIEG
jgi:hypothetical protein